MIKQFTVGVILIGIMSSIVWIFWEQEYKYSLPTPIPRNHIEITAGTYINTQCIFPEEIIEKPVFLHFFNPNCPCSRFTQQHINAMIREHQEEIDFYVVVPPGTRKSKITDRFENHIPLIEDIDGHVSAICGIYSTPQAVLLTKTGNLYYKGNYNKARFCTIPGSNFAELSIASLLAGKSPPDWGPLATTAYGCELNRDEDSPLFGFINYR